MLATPGFAGTMMQDETFRAISGCCVIARRKP
jgi:hypothetical protein